MARVINFITRLCLFYRFIFYLVFLIAIFSISALRYLILFINIAPLSITAIDFQNRFRLENDVSLSLSLS